LQTTYLQESLEGLNSSLAHSDSELLPGVFSPRHWICLSSTTPCELWLDDCVLHQRTIIPSSLASNLLSFAAKEPHCL